MEEPTVQVIETHFFQTKKGKTILVSSISLIILASIAAVIILNYFNIISLNKLSFLPKNKIKDPLSIPLNITLTSNFGFKAGNLTFPCLVENSFCPTQKLVNINNTPTVTYKAASGSSVLNKIKLPSIENIAVSENKQIGKKYFYESIVKDNNSCYTIAYTLPSDATFKDLLNLPVLNNSSKIATLGSETFTIEGHEANVLIQVRNTPMDPGLPCTLINKNPDFFKSFN